MQGFHYFDATPKRRVSFKNIYFMICCFRCSPPPPRFWLFGFLAFWLLGFLAFRLLGFLAFWLLGFSASWLFGFLLVYAAFGGFLALAFRILCIPSSSSRWRFGFCCFWRLWLFASSAFPVPLRAFWLLHPFIGFWIWLPASSASPVFSLFESSLLRTSWGGKPPPNPPATLTCESRCVWFWQHVFRVIRTRSASGRVVATPCASGVWFSMFSRDTCCVILRSFL